MSPMGKLLLTGMGLWALINGLTSKTFYARAFGLGDRTKPIPRWLGRVWFIVLGLWLIVMAWGRVSSLVPRIISIGLGVFVLVYTVGFVRKERATEPMQVLSLPRKGISETWKLPLGILLGVFLIVVGFMLK